MSTNWTDNPATTATRIRTVHVNELRNVVNQNRDAAGLGSYTWTDDPATLRTHIRAVHFTEARSAIQDLWTHQGMGTLPNWSVGSAPSPSRQISARDINDLRNWVDQYEAATGTSYDPPPPPASPYGVDTVNTLGSISWSSFQAWGGYYPAFACRYFDGDYHWEGGEGRQAKTATGGVLAAIAPIQHPDATRQSQGGSTGFSYGQNDANTTCLAVLANINSGELAIPMSGTVYVYLDVEAGTGLSADYWAGWADYVWHYKVNGVEPLYPVMYAHFTFNPINNVYQLDQPIQDALNKASAAYPNSEVCCFGFWASEPEFCQYCDPHPTLAMPQYATYSQPCAGGSRMVPMLLWQYAQHGDPVNGGGCVGPTTAPQPGCGRDPTVYAGGQNLDLDFSLNTASINYMLLIK